MSLESPIFGSAEERHEALINPNELELPPPSSESKDTTYKKLGAEFVPKSYEELTAESEARKERLKNRAKSFKSKMVSRFGSSFIGKTFKAAGKAWTRTKEETSRFVFSVPELYHYKMQELGNALDTARNAPDILLDKAIESRGRMGTSVKKSMEKSFGSVVEGSAGDPQQEAYFTKASENFDSLDERVEEVNRSMEIKFAEIQARVSNDLNQKFAEIDARTKQEAKDKTIADQAKEIQKLKDIIQFIGASTAA